MKILQFNNYADPLGGAEVYAFALTRELVKRGHQLLFFGSSPEREVDEENLRVIQRPRYDPNLLLRDPALSSALALSLDRFRPELVHVHNVHGLGIDVLDVLRACSAPIVQTIHDFSLLCPNSWCVRADGSVCSGGVGVQCFRHSCQRNYPYDAEVALHTLLKHRMLAAAVDVAIAPSMHLAERMSASGFGDVRHRNYFLDPIDAGGRERERESKALVFIGRLEPEKGVATLLDAMPMILLGDPDVRLTIIGGGVLARELTEKCSSLRLEGCVRFLSHVPRAELGSYYSSSTACVIPSIWSENSPLVAYECLAAGLPMIASHIGGIPELVVEGQAGFTFAAGNSTDLARKVLQFLALPSEERTRMSTWMRQHARTFHPDAHVDWILDIYARLGAQPTRARAAALQVDSDLLAILEQYRCEKAQLSSLFHEHINYIRHLERTLATRAPAPVENFPSLSRGLQISVRPHTARLRKLLAGTGPARLLKRLARALPRAIR